MYVDAGVFFQAEDGIRDLVRSRGLGDVYKRQNQTPKRVSATHGFFPMTYRIDAVNVEITTPAGDFSDCLLVEGRAGIRLYVDAARTWRDVPLVTREWYCPKVGLVKLERVEPTPSRLMTGGTYTMELTAWQ